MPNTHARRATLTDPTVPAASTITAGPALGTWLAGWAASSVLSAVAFAVAGSITPVPIPVIAVSLMLGWSAYLAGMVLLSRNAGTGDFVRDYGVTARWVDVIGVPVGVLCQLVVVPLVYLPLQSLWPSTFDEGRLQDNATSLADRATGSGSVVSLVLVIVVGAPVVEELVYRGLVQQSLAGRFHHLVAWLCTAGLFTLIHFRPVEYPGLGALALIVGAAALLTGRLGPAIAIHVGFNATGLLLAFL